MTVLNSLDLDEARYFVGLGSCSKLFANVARQ